MPCNRNRNRIPRPRPRDGDGDDDDDSPPANESRWTMAGRPYRVRAWSAAEFAALTPCDRSILRKALRCSMARRLRDGSWHVLLAG